jgi:predicted nucleic acid-binding protein
VSGPPRVVLDTSTLVRAALGPAAGRLLDRLIGGGHLVASLETIAEAEAVPGRPKLAARLPEAVCRRFLRRLALGTLVVGPGERVSECRDPEDDKFLEATLTKLAGGPWEFMGNKGGEAGLARESPPPL